MKRKQTKAPDKPDVHLMETLDMLAERHFATFKKDRKKFDKQVNELIAEKVPKYHRGYYQDFYQSMKQLYERETEPTRT